MCYQHSIEPIREVSRPMKRAMFAGRRVPRRSGGHPASIARRRSRVFHASSTAPVPNQTGGAVGEGWETQLHTPIEWGDVPVYAFGQGSPVSNRAMFPPADIPPSSQPPSHPPARLPD